jgi:hypothetical protein
MSSRQSPWFLATLVLLLGGVVATRAADNLVPNGGFEQGLTGWSFGGDGKAELDTTVAVEGKQCLYLPLLATPGSNPGRLEATSSPFALPPDTLYLFTCRYRSLGFVPLQRAGYGIVNLCRFRLLLSDAAGQPLGTGPAGLHWETFLDMPFYSVDWGIVEKVFRTPAAPSTGRVHVDVVKDKDEPELPVQVWLDDARVVALAGPPAQAPVRFIPAGDLYETSTVFLRTENDLLSPHPQVRAAHADLNRGRGLRAGAVVSILGGPALTGLAPGVYTARFLLRAEGAGEVQQPLVQLYARISDAAVCGTWVSGRWVYAGDLPAGAYHPMEVPFWLPPGDTTVSFEIKWGGNGDLYFGGVELVGPGEAP